MLQKALLLRLFGAFSIQRWNDQIRPVSFVEMEKHAHKLCIAYCLAKYEEDAGQSVNWHNIILGGIFELLRRCVLSDIQSPIYRKIRSQHPNVFKDLTTWVYQELEPSISNPDFLRELESYLIGEDLLDKLSRDILSAAHIYSTYWEFMVIRQASPSSSAMRKIEHRLILDFAPYMHLHGLQLLLDEEPVSRFIDLFGQLRFQARWGRTPRIPVTSVLGHSMMVACVSYLLTRGLKEQACSSRLRNTFFGGLFHDFPEALTRDIISPVKNSIGTLERVIAGIEKELVEKEILPLIEASWRKDFCYFTQDEFTSKIIIDGRTKHVSSDEINNSYNSDAYNPIDGELIRVADNLAVFLEAKQSVEAGFKNTDMEECVRRVKDTYKKRIMAGINIESIFANL